MSSTILEVIEGLLARPELDPAGDNAKRLRKLAKQIGENVYITPPDVRFINKCLATLDNIECAALDHYARCTSVLCPERGRACPMVGTEQRFAACDYYIGRRGDS
jgi:hypothetical protein